MTKTKTKLLISILLLMNLLAVTTPIYAVYSPYAGPDQYTLSGQTVTLSGSFDASYSASPDKQYEWDFGDGSPPQTGTPSSSTVSVNHIYIGSQGDTFVARFGIWVNGAIGEWEYDTVNIMINHLPVADADGPYSGDEGSSISFDGSGSYDPDGSIVLYEWDFDNDGTYDYSSVSSSSASHTYQSDGSYTVKLRVTDDDGATDTDTTTVTVNNPPPSEIHDVAAVDQTVSENKVLPGTVIDIDVTVTNLGTFTETFDLACYYNNFLIGSVLVVDLAPSETRVVTFSWDTSGVPLNTYAINAHADSGGVISEVDEGNNWCVVELPIFVVPELPFGAVMALVSMMVATVLFRRRT